MSKLALRSTSDVWSRFFRAFIAADTATGDNFRRTYLITIRYCDELKRRGVERDYAHKLALEELATEKRIATYPLVAPTCPCGVAGGTPSQRRWSCLDEGECAHCERKFLCVGTTPNAVFQFGSSEAERRAIADEQGDQ